MQTEIRLVYQHFRKFTLVNTTNQGIVYRPYLPVRLSYSDKAVDVNAIVDTGADFSMFDKGIARSLQIPEDGLSLENPLYKLMVLQLKGKTLGCFCKPQACHGDVIKEWLDEN